MQQGGRDWPAVPTVHFQSPIHRGDRCNCRKSSHVAMGTWSFSPLFIGVIGATRKDASGPGYPLTFSHLFIGVIGATWERLETDAEAWRFQSPIHRGDRCNRGPNMFRAVPRLFQSPIHRGDRCNIELTPDDRFSYEPFSPLFIGVIGATQTFLTVCRHLLSFQSPIHRGDRCNGSPFWRSPPPLHFQSPIHRGDRCNIRHCLRNRNRGAAFSPLFIGVIGATRPGCCCCAA